MTKAKVNKTGNGAELLAHEEEANARREMLKQIGLTAGALAVTALGSSGVSARGEKAQREMGALPLRTRAADLLPEKEAAAKLTPAARKLTKADLITLQDWERGQIPERLESLTIRDIRSIKDAFSTSLRMRPMVADGVSCCCCTPCCCAAAVVKPVRNVA